MKIAMKTYLLLPFFFSVYLLFPSSGLAEQTAEEPPPTTHAATTDESVPAHPKESQFSHLIDHPHLPDSLIERAENETDTFQSKFLNMLFILSLLIGFMILASWMLKRMMKTKIGLQNTASNIKILETRYLSPRATLYLVEIQEKSFLIAESPTAVTFLSSIPHDTGVPH